MYDAMIFALEILFFFQAEDGIRDGHVTGVQTCALPISGGDACLDSGGGPLRRPGTGCAMNGRFDRQSGRAIPFLAGYYAALIALLYLPIAVLFLFSINANATLTFPLQGLTLDWYRKVFATHAAIDAARNSVVVAAGSSAVATILATMLAILIVRYQFRGKRLLIGLAVLPLIVPYVVLAVAL